MVNVVMVDVVNVVVVLCDVLVRCLTLFNECGGELVVLKWEVVFFFFFLMKCKFEYIRTPFKQNI